MSAFATSLQLRASSLHISTPIRVQKHSVQTPQPSAIRVRCALSSAREQRARERRALAQFDAPSLNAKLRDSGMNGKLRRRTMRTLQINIGLTCDLACRHCHVESSPLRTETMPREVADRLIELTARDGTIQTVDITGGAPEMHAQFRYLIEAFRQQGLRVMDRCNLVVLEEQGQEDTAEFLAANGVKIVASLPCYSAENVEKQRGDGVFDASIRVLQKLNKLGYGVQGSGLELDLVYNPTGPTLPPAQRALEEDFKQELRRAFDIEFNNLICIANMPIKRFADDLIRFNQMQMYLDLLVSNFNMKTVDSVMCLDMIHVAWDGTLHDCDFNYALGMTMRVKRDSQAASLPDALTVFDIESWSSLLDKPIETDTHCFGCTAGSGSSCGGSLAE